MAGFLICYFFSSFLRKFYVTQSPNWLTSTYPITKRRCVISEGTPNRLGGPQ